MKRRVYEFVCRLLGHKLVGDVFAMHRKYADVPLRLCDRCNTWIAVEAEAKQ